LLQVCVEELVVKHRSTLTLAVKEILKNVLNSMDASLAISDDETLTLKQMFALFHRAHLMEPQNPVRTTN
jgi:hypothetical protein